MQHGHPGLGVVHRLVVHHVVLARLRVGLVGGEALLLDPGTKSISNVVQSDHGCLTPGFVVNDLVCSSVQCLDRDRMSNGQTKI